MPDYEKMYLTLFHATEHAINTLIAAQRTCEELYLSQPEPNLKLISSSIPSDDSEQPLTEH